ncbi:FAD-dependent monooxygenase [Myroides sp. LJL119]
MQVAIIGGGIAGLTMGIALERANIPYTVYEATSQIKPVGAGIALASNAMQVYRYLGLEDLIAQKGMAISKVLLTDMRLKELTSSDLAYFKDKYKLENIAIHRHELHQVLLEAIPKNRVVLNKRLQNITKQENGDYLLTFSDTTTCVAQYIIGADGLRSKVREHLFGQAILRDAHQVCWRGTLQYDMGSLYDNTAIEAWGKAKRFGFVKLDSKTLYWYFLINQDLYNNNMSLNSYLHQIDPQVADFIRKTPDEAIFKDKIFDLKPLESWHKHRVCLIGDAAHATTPNLGQGACQGIEDVYVISKLLQRFPLELALMKFSAIRRPKALKVVKHSWLLGKVAQIKNPVFVQIRNMCFKYMPEFLKQKQMQMLFDLQKVE